MIRRHFTPLALLFLTFALSLLLLPARADPAESGSPPSPFDWPTGSPATLLRGFDPPAYRWQSGHRGVDLSLPAGAEVRSAGDGTVAYVGSIGGTPVVAIEHGSGLRTTYQPVIGSLKHGDTVTAGAVIGTLGEDEHCTSSCLHWGAKYGTGRHEHYIDPLSLLRPLRYRLVPL